jgi:hypothetical protein
MPLFRRDKSTLRRFEPIRILPFTWREKRRLIRAAAVPARAYSFPFNLSSRPPAKWVEFFQTAWYQQQGGSEFPEFKGRTITAVSTLADLQNTLSILKLVVTSANEKYGALVRQRVEAEEAEKMKKEEISTKAEREMGDALSKLKF